MNNIEIILFGILGIILWLLVIALGNWLSFKNNIIGIILLTLTLGPIGLILGFLIIFYNK